MSHSCIPAVPLLQRLVACGAALSAAPVARNPSPSATAARRRDHLSVPQPAPPSFTGRGQSTPVTAAPAATATARGGVAAGSRRRGPSVKLNKRAGAGPPVLRRPHNAQPPTFVPTLGALAASAAGGHRGGARSAMEPPLAAVLVTAASAAAQSRGRRATAAAGGPRRGVGAAPPRARARAPEPRRAQPSPASARAAQLLAELQFGGVRPAHDRSSLLDAVAMQDHMVRTMKLELELGSGSGHTAPHRRRREPPPSSDPRAAIDPRAGLQHVEASSAKWTCDACTLTNSGAVEVCMACGTPAPEPEHVSRRAPLSLAQQRGLVPRPPSPISKAEWTALESQAAARLSAPDGADCGEARIRSCGRGGSMFVFAIDKHPAPQLFAWSRSGWRKRSC